MKTYNKEYYLKNKEKIKAQKRQYYLDNKEDKLKKDKKYREDNREDLLTYHKDYYHSNKSKWNGYRGKRRAQEKLAYPSWANDSSIQAIYAMSKFLSKTTFGKGYHVDHIVPLQSKEVCGLHCEDNLQIIRAEHNLSKGNTHG